MMFLLKKLTFLIFYKGMYFIHKYKYFCHQLLKISWYSNAILNFTDNILWTYYHIPLLPLFIFMASLFFNCCYRQSC